RSHSSAWIRRTVISAGMLFSLRRVAERPASPMGARDKTSRAPLTVFPYPVLKCVSSPSASSTAPAHAPKRSGGAATPYNVRVHTPGKACLPVCGGGGSGRYTPELPAQTCLVHFLSATRWTEVSKHFLHYSVKVI